MAEPADNAGRVAVIIPAYNRWPQVADAVDSALAQSYPAVDVIVVDDGSTDGTAARLAERCGERLQVIALAENGEKSRARNRGLAAATAEFVCFLDSDDVLLPDSVADRVRVFQSDPAFDGVAYGSTRRPGRPPCGRSFPSGDLLPAYVDDFGLLNNNAFLLRRARLQAIGAYRPELTNMEDRELLLRLAAQLEFRYCGAATQEVRRLAGSARSNYAKILAQGCGVVAALRADGHVPARLGERFRVIAFSEDRERARALYKLGRRRDFVAAARALFAEFPDFLRGDWVFRRRLLLARIGALFDRRVAGSARLDTLIKKPLPRR